MTSPSPTPSTSSSVGFLPFTTQVAGHLGQMTTTEDGSLLIKTALPREVAFYEALQHDKALEQLRVFTPQFLGTLRLEGQVDPAQADSTAGIIVQPLEGEAPGTVKDMFFPSRRLLNWVLIVSLQSIVLENLTYPFLKPNILDVKLGTILYDDTASPEKKARMERAAKETTSGVTGIRLTGFQVYDNITSQPVHTLKQYGKALKPHQLGEGIAKFFPLGQEIEESAPAAAPVAGADDVEMASSSTVQSFGLPLELLTPMLQGIREDIALIREVMESVEVRMVAASLLIIYEADWDRAEEALTRYFTEEDNEESEEEEDEDDDDESKPKKIGPPFVVKLIDFAHSIVTPGNGPDPGVLLGLETLVKLLDDRLKEVAP